MTTIEMPHCVHCGQVADCDGVACRRCDAKFRAAEWREQEASLTAGGREVGGG